MLAIAELFDGATLIFINFLLSLVSAVVMLFVRAGMPNARGLTAWTASNIFFALGFLLLLSYYLFSAPPLVESLIANLLIDAGSITAYIAVLLFLRRPRSRLWVIAPALLLIMVEIGLYARHGANMAIMVPLGASARAIVTIGAGWQLLRHAPSYMRPASTIGGIFHFSWALMLVSRTAWWISSHFAAVDWDPTTPFALIARIVLTFVVTPGYLWMIARQLDQALLEQAQQDPLTGIPNRRVMWHRGQRQAEFAMTQHTPVGLLMIDVDHFKSVNDRFGHGVGDEVLVGIAKALAANMREGDLVARVGGEEFMVLLPGASYEDAYNVAERLRAAVECLPFPLDDGGTLHCTISMGISVLDQDAIDWPDLVRTADRALYCAKQLGRNRIESAPPVRTPAIA